MKKSKFFTRFLASSIGFSLIGGVAFAIFLNKNINEADASSYSVNSVPTTINLNDAADSVIRNYYGDLVGKTSSELSGTNLLKNLKPILKNGQKYFSYGSSATTAVWQIYEIVDRDWEKSPASSISGYNSSTNTITGYTYGSSNSNPGTNPYVHALYVNRNVTNQTRAWGNHNQDQWGINQEHVWAKSCGFNDNSPAAGARGDVMHLWAGNGKVNGTYHSNYYYGYVDTTQSYDDASSYASTLSGNKKGKSKTKGGSYTVFEPQDSDKGDIARAIFYMAARYNYLSGSDSDGIDAGNPNLELTNQLNWAPGTSYTSSTTKKGQMGILQDLLEWNRIDPPDAWEIHRNNLLYNNYTKNRNPFIDFPEWAEFIWGKCVNGSYSSASTGSANPNSDTINDFSDGGTSSSGVTSVSVSPTALSLDLNGTTSGNLTASVTADTGISTAVTWKSSNTSVATVNSSGVVTAVAVGNAEIIVTSDVDSSKHAACSVTVVDSSSSGGGGSETETGDATMETGTNSTTCTVNSKNGVKIGTGSKGGNMTITVPAGTTSLDLYAAAWKGGTCTLDITGATTSPSSISLTSDTGISNSTPFTLAGTESTYKFTISLSGIETSTTLTFATNSNAGNRCVVWGATYIIESSSTTKTLTDISIDDSNVDHEFQLNDTFNYSGLVVTATYDDESEDTVEPTSVSSPDMTSAGVKTVTVSYTEGGVTKTAEYEITVLAPVVTEITATVSKTFHVGETITSSDIHVEDNLGNEITDFTFANDGYQFTYEDAASGGASTQKTFTNTITYSTFTCDLTVSVSREAYVTPSTAVTDTIDKAFTGINSGSYGTWSNTGSSGATYSGYTLSQKSTNYVQFNYNSTKNYGIVTSAYSGSTYVREVSITFTNSTQANRNVKIFGKTTAYSSTSDLYNESTSGTLLGTIVYNGSDATSTLNITGNYQYIGILSISGASYCSSITVTYGQSDTALNVANYIMYEDTNNQCLTKLDLALNKLNAMSAAEKTTFNTSNDYVILTARTRLEAWAIHEGKTLTYSDGTFSANTKILNVLINAETTSSVVPIIVVISLLGASAIGGYFLLRRKKEE